MMTRGDQEKGEWHEGAKVEVKLSVWEELQTV